MIESRIQEAMSAGVFRNLPGEGKPLGSNEAEKLAGNQWLGFKVLRDADLLPDWLLQARDIEKRQERLAELDARHGRLVEAARESGEWHRFMPGIDQLRRDYERDARELRRRQDRFNHDAPSVRLERPGIWVEYHLERLDSRLSCPVTFDD